ncbi:hypothetical protein ACOCJ7_05005 [Knoellia sp. CPCC 206453]|uniref:hypothetical protein n=1 Tax=Knoellia pratensis TaxID=3404796 RepID=UPI00360A2699
MVMRTVVEVVGLAWRTVLPFVTYAVSGLGARRDRRINLAAVPSPPPAPARGRPRPRCSSGPHWRLGCH